MPHLRRRLRNLGLVLLQLLQHRLQLVDVVAFAALAAGLAALAAAALALGATVAARLGVAVVDNLRALRRRRGGVVLWCAHPGRAGDVY